MPPRNKVYDLPPEIRDELNEKLVSTGFQGYSALAEWLAERGYNVSRSSVHRYGQDLQEEFEDAMGDVRKTTELAKAMAADQEDESGHLIDATARMVQDQLLRITIAMRKAEQDPAKAAKQLGSVTRALAEIGRVSLGQKKWAREILQEKRAQLEGKVDEAAKGKKTLTVDDFKAAVREVYGG